MIHTQSIRRLSALLLGLALASPAADGAERKLEYNRDIRPILAENCFACHGPDSAARKADLRIDRREDALAAEAIIPGKPEDSGLVQRLFETDASRLMPPPKSGKKLTPAQKEILKQWVAQGAEYQPHWSYIAAKRPAVPAVQNKTWVRNPIDAFVLAQLEKKGLTPAPEADRRTLIRRLSLDLTGLPPKPEEVEAFINDPSPDAYEKLVDRLLKSPHWGEHRGRYWLDNARYADTHGIHFDNFREIHAYRDWVIQAFNKNMPFDQFTIEQLAGDLLPNPTLDQRIATGFNRCNITTNEGGVIPEEYLVLYTRDRTETTAAVFMGMTAGCAVCHDHKLDPLSQREFYQMASFFNNTTQGAMDGNIKDTPPVLFVPSLEDRPRWDKLTAEIAELRKKSEERKKAARADYDKWLADSKPEQIAKLIPSNGLTASASLGEGQGDKLNFVVNGQPRVVPITGPVGWEAGHITAKALKIQPGTNVTVPDLGDFDAGKPFSYGAWVKLPRNGLTGAILSRMDEAQDYRGWDLWIQGNLPGVHIVNKWPSDALKVVAQTPLQPRKWYHLFITYDGSGTAAGVKVYVNGVVQPTTIEASSLRSTPKTSVPFKLGQRNNSSRVDNFTLQDVRIYDRALTGPEVDTLNRSTHAVVLLSKEPAKRTNAEKNELFDWWLAGLDEPYKALSAKLAAVQQEEVTIKSRGTIAHVMQERGEEAKAHILFRGDYDKRRDEVKAATPAILPPMPKDLPRNRLGFAQWLLRPEHPLTARVTVNRFWQSVFGNGLVDTTGDFGIAGDLPSHPELLDWLAVEFRETSWDIKRFYKLMVMSSTYRQAAVVTPEKREKDANNRLLSRGPRYRMDGEMIRDYALAASGLLVPKLGGPSVKPYQPEGVWEAVAMIGSNTRDYRPDTGENLYRRSMYTFWKRSAPPASMDIFNAPSRETCAVRRERTNTPLQALVTLNDVQFVEAARVLAEKTIKQGGAKTEERIDFIARRLLARPTDSDETKVVANLAQDLVSHYQANPAEAKKLIAVGESKADPAVDAPTLAAWTMVINQMMNLDEVLNK